MQITLLFIGLFIVPRSQSFWFLDVIGTPTATTPCRTFGSTTHSNLDELAEQLPGNTLLALCIVV